MNYSATKKYMDILRAHYDDCSDYRIAQLLGVTKACVSRWSNGKNGMGDEAAAKLADLCGLDGVEVLTEMYLERAKTRATRNYFEEVMKRSASAQLVVFSVAFYFLAPMVSGFSTV